MYPPSHLLSLAIQRAMDTLPILASNIRANKLRKMVFPKYYKYKGNYVALLGQSTFIEVKELPKITLMSWGENSAVVWDALQYGVEITDDTFTDKFKQAFMTLAVVEDKLT